MLFTAFIFIVVFFFISAEILREISKLFKISTVTYGKSLIVVLISLVILFTVAIIAKVGGVQLGWPISIVEFSISYFVFFYLYKRYYQASYGKITGIYFVGLILSVILILVVWAVISPFLQELAGPADQIRQTISKDYIASDVETISTTPPGVVWGSRQSTIFSISDNPIFKQYGYNKPQIIKGNQVSAIPNNSATLFVVPTINRYGGDKPLEGYATSSVMVFSKDLSIFKVIPLLPQMDAYEPLALAWLGDRFIFVNNRNSYIQSADYGNHFYIMDTTLDNPVFGAIETPDDLKKGDYIYPTLYSHPSKQIAAISYCLITVQLYDSHYCGQGGVSVVTPQKIVEIIRKNNQDTFDVGWDSNNMYVRETDQKTNIQTIYVSSLAQYID